MVTGLTVIISEMEKPINEVCSAVEMLGQVVEPVCINFCD